MSSSRFIPFFAFAIFVMALAGCRPAATPATTPASPSPPVTNTISKQTVYACGDTYPNQATAPYVLPYTIGSSFIVGQGNCTDESHNGNDAFAYDIDMPISTPIVATRAGRVQSIEERYRDGNRSPGQENFITILHSDGTIAEYVHLTFEGVSVAIGDEVQQGAIIGRSGDTGDSTEPHLHFQINGCAECSSMPITFRNTELHPNGLQELHSYEAL